MQEQKNKLFNITKYLLDCYNKKIEPLKELMGNVNFSEISSLKIFYLSEEGNSINYDIKETLAQNIITNLPFQAYENYVTADWLNYSENNESILPLAIYFQNYQLIEKIHQLSFDALKEDNNLIYSYSRNFISPILNIQKTFYYRSSSNDLDKDFVNYYHKLLQKVSDEKKFISQFYFIKAELKEFKELKKSKKNNWFETACKDNYDIKGTYANSILSVLSTKDDFKDILADALSQILSNNKIKGEIKEIIGVENSKMLNVDNALHVAIRNNSFECASLLIESARLSHEEVRDSYDAIIRKNLGSYDCKVVFSSILNENSGKFYIELKNKYFPNSESRFTPLFILSENKELREKIEEKTETILKSGFYLDSKRISFMNELIPLAKMFNDFIEQWKDIGKIVSLPKESSSLSSSESRKVPLEFGLASYLISERKEYLNQISLKNLTNENWENLNRFIYQIPSFAKLEENENENIRRVTISQTDLNIWFDAYKLQTKLSENQELKSKKLKL